MTEEEYERGLEIQGYKKSIADMTLGDIALKFLKEHHLPKFLKTILVKFAYPLLLLKDVDLYKAKEIIKNLLILKNDHYGNTKMEWRVEVTEQAEQFLKE